MTELETTIEPAPVAKGAAILCVDDDPRVLSALDRALRREPYEVLRAGGGEEALDLLERVPVKVLVTDERMPEMSGSVLLATVAKRWPLMGRIILTGYPGLDLMIRSLEVGTDFLMIKPWDDELLRRTIRRLIQEVDKLTAYAAGHPPEPGIDAGGE